METIQKLGINDNNTNARENGTTNETIKTNGIVGNGATPTVPVKPARYMIHGKTIATPERAFVKAAQPCVTNGTPIDDVQPAIDKADAGENDEIEFLLDEIRDLEIPACRTDSEREDFEIAGSRTDLNLSLHLDSPVDTSWYYFSIIKFYSPNWLAHSQKSCYEYSK